MINYGSDPDHNLALAMVCALECLEYDDCLWTFGGSGVSPDGYLNKYGNYLPLPRWFALS